VETIIGALGAASVVLLTLLELFLPAERLAHRPSLNQRISRSQPPR